MSKILMARKTGRRLTQGVFLCSLIICIVISLTGCRTNARSSGIASQFEIVDSFIQHNQYKDALKELKKLEKKVYDFWGIIAVYKRYNLLSEDKLSEKVLKDGLKRFDKSEELSAIYVSFLLKKNRFEEAEKMAFSLKGTKYSSLYAEAVFKNQEELFQNGENSSLYKNNQYYSIFKDSYDITKNPVWLRDCAAFWLCNGDYKKAGNLTPEKFENADDAFFWALINFDSGNFIDSIEACNAALRFMESLGQTYTKNTSEIRLSALMADSYAVMAEDSLSSAVRDKIISSYINDAALSNLGSIMDGDLLSLICVNAANALMAEGDYEKAYSLLSYTVNYFPLFVPGLISYADFSWNTSLEREENDEIMNLRRSGLATLDMERYDSRRKIPVSDAIYKIDSALEKIQDPKLYIKKLDLRFKTDESLTLKDKSTYLWRMLEESSSDNVKFHDDLIRYAVVFFLNTKQTEAAEILYYKYMAERYSLDKTSFFDSIVNRVTSIDTKDVELGAWFAFNSGKNREGIRLLEYCVFESTGLNGDRISPAVSSRTAINLANVYFSLGEKDKALDLYGKAAGFEGDALLRSEIFYRIACIYIAYSETKNALRAVDYAVSLNPQNARAHLLKTKLK